jgi:hypothetical protein
VRVAHGYRLAFGAVCVFKHRELREPAVVRGAIRSPANETRRVPEPATTLEVVD